MSSCGFGQIPDLRGKSLCLKGTEVIDGKRNANFKNGKVSNLTVRKDAIICGDLDIKGELTVNGNSITGGGGSGGASPYSLHAVLNFSSSNTLSTTNPRSIPFGPSFTTNFPNSYHHVFTGPVGDYKVTISGVNLNVSSNIATITEIANNELLNPVPSTAVDIGVISGFPNTNYIGSSNVTATRTPCIWYYWDNGGSGSNYLFDVHVEQILD